MRICYFADGRYIHALRWMKFFSLRGHEMHLISFAPMTEENISAMENIGVKCHGAIGNFHLKRFWLTLADLKKLRTILEQEKIDILHCHFLGTNAWYAMLSGFHPYILTIMGADVVGKNWKPSKEFREKRLTPLSLKKADLVTAWSQSLADAVRPFCKLGTSIEVVHGGIDLNRFEPAAKPAYLFERCEIPAGANCIFTPRLLRPLYNTDKLAEAMGIVLARKPNVYLIIACPTHILDASYLEKIEQILKGNSSFENARFIPSIPHDEIADFYRLADVTVSIPDTDGTPMTVLESMACGTPTVIGRLADYDKMYFEDKLTTLMVDQKDPQSIADGVLKYLEDDALTTRIVDEARKRVLETGGYEYQMGKMESLYQQLHSSR